MRRQEKQGLFSKKNMVSFFIVFIMISSVVGFMWGRSDNRKEKYNGIPFEVKDKQWVTVINDAQVGFDFFPTEVESIELSPDIMARLSNTLEIDTTYDINDTNKEAIALAQYKMGLMLNNLNIFVRRGLIGENDLLPIINCDDSTDLVPVIYFRSSNETKVFLEDDCIITESRNAQDFLKIKERMLYGIVGVIK